MTKPDYVKAVELLIDKVDKLREQIVELKAENKKYKDVLEFLVVSNVNDGVKMECVKRALHTEKCWENAAKVGLGFCICKEIRKG